MKKMIKDFVNVLEKVIHYYVPDHARHRLKREISDLKEKHKLNDTKPKKKDVL